MKMARLGVEVVVQPKSERTTTTSAKSLDELPAIEDVMKVLSNALAALKEPGIDQSARFLFHPLSARDEIVLLSLSAKVKPVSICGRVAESTGSYDDVKQRKSLELATAK